MKFSPKSRERKKLLQLLSEEIVDESGYHVCGGKWMKVGTKTIPDFRCENCGQRMDVKAGIDARDYDALCISQTPWDKYKDNMLIWLMYGTGKFVWAYKGDLYIKSGPHSPSGGGNYGDTWFYLIGPMEAFEIVEVRNYDGNGT